MERVVNAMETDKSFAINVTFYWSIVTKLLYLTLSEKYLWSLLQNINRTMTSENLNVSRNVNGIGYRKMLFCGWLAAWEYAVWFALLHEITTVITDCLFCPLVFFYHCSLDVFFLPCLMCCVLCISTSALVLIRQWRPQAKICSHSLPLGRFQRGSV